jgi:hypothetical protein
MQPAVTGSSGSSSGGSSVHVLLVSGGGKKKAFDSVAALQALQQQQAQAQARGSAPRPPPLPPLAVAFNPYLPDAAAAAAERARLRAKLQTGLVSAVYLQMGTDLGRLQAGLACVREALQELGLGTATQQAQQQQHGQARGVALYGSVFLPSKRLLAQMRFR